MRWCKTFTQASTLQSSTCLYEQTAPCERSFLWRQSHTELSPHPAAPSVWQLLSLLPPGFFLFLVLWLSDSSLVSSAVTQSRKLHYKHSDKPAVATCRHVETSTSVYRNMTKWLVCVWDVSCSEMDVATTETPNSWQSLDLCVLSAAGPTILFSAVKHW